METIELETPTNLTLLTNQELDALSFLINSLAWTPTVSYLYEGLRSLERQADVEHARRDKEISPGKGPGFDSGGTSLPDKG